MSTAPPPLPEPTPTPPAATPPPPDDAPSPPPPPEDALPPTATPPPESPPPSSPPPFEPPPAPVSVPPPVVSPPPPKVSAPPPVVPPPAPPVSVPPPVVSPPTPPVSVPPPVVSPPTPPVSVPPPVVSPPTPPVSTPPPVVQPPAPSPPEPSTPPSLSPPRPATPPSSSPPSPPEPATPPSPSPREPGTSPSTSPPSPPTPPSRPPPGRSPGTPSVAPPPPPPPSSESSGGVSTALVVGIAAGGVVVVALVLLVAFFCSRKRRRESVPPPGAYYGGRDDYHAEQWQYQAPPPLHPGNAGKVPPHIPPPPAYASRPPMLPPPALVFSSSGGSASNYSGSENQLPPLSTGVALGFARSTFTFEELMLATDGFSDANLLGQGGFGYVHRGMLPNGKEVAVKQMKAGSGQGEREFQAEVEVISRVHHKHLVYLVGYCITGERRLLVYEFVPNNTLEFHLHGKGRPTMDWSTRLKIALGSAKGLAYLHEDCHPKIIHRDIKATNILLDYKFEPKVSDFGLAKFTSDADTHVSTRVMGTFGYLAPEYATTGKLSDKSDVFSFGVVLLELITGRRPVETTNTLFDDSLVDWARPMLTRALEDGNYDALADPRLQKQCNTNEMACMVACAAACVRHSARRRPRMSQVVRTLEGGSSLDDLNEGVIPGHTSVYGSYAGSDYDSSQYNEDLKKFKKTALSSREYASSGYSAATSEYGQNPSASSSEAVTRETGIAKTKQEPSATKMDVSKEKQEHSGFQ